MTGVAEAKLMAAVLEEGESAREVCPFCRGGSSGEKSFNMTRKDGAVLYNCHRASCGASGAIGGNRVVRTTQKERKRKITPYEGELEPLSEEWKEYLATKIGWTDWHLREGRPMYAPEEHRIAFPIHSPMGLRRGWVLRSYEPYERYKTLTRMDVDEPHLSWYRPHHSRSVLVVEDIPSAVRAARYIDAVALCGSGCSVDYASEIAAYYRNVVWGLDEDATAHAIKLMKQHRLLFDSSMVLCLEQDLKDQEEEELCQCITSMTPTER